jgi:predicted DNA-binding transcriptional regulator AlpA
MTTDTTDPPPWLATLVAALRSPVALLLPAEDAAALLGQSRSGFYAGVAAQTLPAPVQTPSGPRWRRKDLEAWVERQKARRRSRRAAASPSAN